MSKQKWIVMIDDNFNFMDSNERYKDSEHNSYEDAVARCKAIVDEYLESDLKSVDTAEKLYGSYTMFGEDPYIIGEKLFPYSSWKYAEKRCAELTK